MTTEGQSENPQNERQDVGPKAAFAVSFALFVFFAGLIAIAGWYYWKDFARQAQQYGKYGLPSESVGPRPGAWTTKDLEKYREQENATLNSYSWSDASKTQATVPIGRAVDLAIEKGILKKREGGSDAP